MASYNLNEILKKKYAAARENAADGAPLALDDVARVKVLSPGRQVFKRFIRNRLAVFGSVLLIVMFVFAFLGPLLYPYGQKQIFYKYDAQNVDYALAKEVTAYTGYDIDASVSVPRSVTTSMNSNVKKMIAAGQDTMLVLDGADAYLIERMSDDIFTLSAVEAEQAASIGSGSVSIGVYDQLSGTVAFEGEAIEGLEAAIKENFSARGGELTFQGDTYTYAKGNAKSYNISRSEDGIHYTGNALGAAFEKALTEASETGADFTSGDALYALVRTDGGYDVYRVGARTPAKVYSRLVFNTFVTGASVSDELRVGALLSAAQGGSFSADGQDFTVSEEDGLLILRDGTGAEYAELSGFSVRRYTGEDTMDYDLKKEIAAVAWQMAEEGSKSAAFVYNLPLQQEDGQYSYDEDGNLLYAETEMKITQRDTGSYVINCDQIIYVIDMFSGSTKEHILGTDGDGFDVLARIMYGGRISLMVGFVVVFIEILLGVIMGGLAGYYGGWVDNLIMRLVDIFYCLPSLPIMIILGAMMDSLRMDTYVRLIIMMAVLGLLGWAGVARMVRGQILSLREQEFMVAAEATGIRVGARIFRHLVPNVMPQLIVIATMGMGSVILTESTLSYLGLGVKHPLATWGTIINSVSSSSAMAHYPYIWIPVGLLICLTVIAFNFVGDGLRDAYDPKSKR